MLGLVEPRYLQTSDIDIANLDAGQQCGAFLRLETQFRFKQRTTHPPWAH